MTSTTISGDDKLRVGAGGGSSVGHSVGGQEQVALTWETPNLAQQTMIGAHFSLFVNKGT